MLASRMLERLVRTGTLHVIDARGRRYSFGDSGAPEVTVRLKDRRLHWKLFTSPALTLGEAYMNGRLVVERGTLYDLMALIGINLETAGCSRVNGPTDLYRRAFRRFQQFNPTGWARVHVAHHYDLSGALYDLFLDDDKQYSCAYFTRPDATLEEAQEAKKRHIAAKLMIEPGQRVLDIGSGWGGLALYLARETGAKVTGLTLSTEQLAVSRERAENAGLADRVEFQLRDYREETGTYDRIVSVGMFEHVGIGYFRAFFRQVRDRMTEDGIALLHTIGRVDGPGTTDPWIRKYIFPGGYIPALSEVMPAIERTGLYTCDIEVLRLHYAETLRHWRRRFEANRAQAAELFDERFCRMWEYYLVASEITFRHLATAVFQIQLANRKDAVPITRDYVGAEEARLLGAGRAGHDDASRAA